MPVRMLKGAILGCLMVPIIGQTAQAQSYVQAGPYLAARAAGIENDFGAAAEWFLKALERDPGNPAIIDNCLLSLISLGDLDRAEGVANQALNNDVRTQLVEMVITTTAASDQNWNLLLDQLDQNTQLGERVATLSRAWALVGLGETDAALSTFDAASEVPGSYGFALYHKALALAAMGLFEEALEMYERPGNDRVPRTRRAVIAHVQTLLQLGQSDRALEVLINTFGPNNTDPTIAALREAASSGDAIPFSLIDNAVEGIGEIYATEAAAYIENTPESIVLLYAQISLSLNPDDANTILLTAELLEKLERYAQAGRTYAMLPSDDPAYILAEFGRAEALRRAEQPDLAREVLQSLIRTDPSLAMAYSGIGDIHRSQEEMSAANQAYTQALDLLMGDDSRRWILLYKRGITWHLLDDWPMAEADLRAAVELNPDYAGSLNYLGYSLIERGEKLEEALQMIVRAIAAEPESGAIVDSYGWAMFTLARYNEAVLPMERAAQLLPEDPTINDHLGDVYWAVGRKLEAQFQWRRALSFATDPEMIADIQHKLENGLEIAMTEDMPDLIETAQDR